MTKDPDVVKWIETFSSNSGAGGFVCKHCGKEFNFSGKLKDHYRANHGY